MINLVSPFSSEFVGRVIYTVRGHFRLFGFLILGLLLLLGIFIAWVFIGGSE